MLTMPPAKGSAVTRAPALMAGAKGARMIRQSACARWANMELSCRLKGRAVGAPLGLWRARRCFHRAVMQMRSERSDDTYWTSAMSLTAIRHQVRPKGISGSGSPVSGSSSR